VRLSAASRQLERFRRLARGFDEFPLDPQVDYESAARDALTIPAMTSVNNQGRLGQFVSDRAASASTLHRHVIPPGASGAISCVVRGLLAKLPCASFARPL